VLKNAPHQILSGHLKMSIISVFYQVICNIQKNSVFAGFSTALMIESFLEQICVVISQEPMELEK
jgi:hypothetical protein